MEETPLLPPGLHNFELSELSNHFLSDFPTSNTRALLIKGLTKYLELLKTIGISIEVWIDGSFTTKKADPNDIDLVIFASEQEVNGLSEHQKNILNRPGF